jgi:hypothetical protein
MGRTETGNETMSEETKYIVRDANGLIVEAWIWRLEAGRCILQYDSQEFDIRQAQDGSFELWLRKECANRPWEPANAWSFAVSEDEAEAEFVERVIECGWDGLDVLTLEEYEAEIDAARADGDDELVEAMQAELEAMR